MWKYEKGFEAEDIGDCKYPKITIVKLRASGDSKTSEDRQPNRAGRQAGSKAEASNGTPNAISC